MHDYFKRKKQNLWKKNKIGNSKWSLEKEEPVLDKKDDNKNNSELKEENKESLKERFSINDTLLMGITFEELVTAVYSNFGEKATEIDVRKTFNEMLDINIQDAKYELRNQMKKILISIQRGY